MPTLGLSEGSARARPTGQGAQEGARSGPSRGTLTRYAAAKGITRRSWASWSRRVVVLAIVGLLLQVGIVVWRVRHQRLGPIAGGFATVTVDGRTRQVLVKQSWAATDCYSETCKRTTTSLTREVDWFDFNRMLARAAGPAEAPAWYRPWTEEEVLPFLDLATPANGPGDEAFVTFARAGLGWPFRAFQGARAYNGMVDSRGYVSCWTPTSASASPGYLRIGQSEYPLSPIWTGLALDIGIFVGLGVLTFAARDSWLWARRVRDGQCPGCRYDLAGLHSGEPCPECGRATPGG
ncbi:MAG: hypothetical protein IT431_17715 [Phycisphaerales bacterium]|nr:hypothetical protein [Phycisphaerales bacterium]